MFIHSRKNFNISFPDGTLFSIKKGFIGDIPDFVAKHWLLQAAIQEGSIVTPDGHGDRELEQAAEAGDERYKEYDIRNESGQETPEGSQKNPEADQEEAEAGEKKKSRGKQ